MSIRSLLACWVLCCASVFSSLAVAGESLPGRIQVTGEGSAVLAPDMATLSLTVTREGESASAALSANSEAMRQVMAAMREAGVAEKDLQTSNFSIAPRYARPDPRAAGEQQGPTIIGYVVRNGLSVRIRDITLVGKLLDTAVRQGVNEGGQISLGNANPEEAIDLARERAMRDALSRAKVLAAAAGVKTGDIIEIQEQSYRGGPSPAPMFRMSEMAAADSVPVAGGENEYRVSVSLTIAIQP
ncbi:DUF541 domain-containing protein [Parahaliea maris]|uniref:DUF541 domain-containing protein n=1 Tax=Parahaliea maris TaxID=2716870 RepID=A0A5C9A3A3_9GAMM|nr:SIMPL domain-containing protein [Parahaliea maris]TXS95355.1 DUF541 domain-containing protein [Parahaliea maris]